MVHVRVGVPQGGLLKERYGMVHVRVGVPLGGFLRRENSSGSSRHSTKFSEKYQLWYGTCMCVWACHWENRRHRGGTGMGEAVPSTGMVMGEAVPTMGMGMGEEAVPTTGLGSKWDGGMLQ